MGAEFICYSNLMEMLLHMYSLLDVSHEVISPNTLLIIWLLTHAGTKLKIVQQIVDSGCNHYKLLYP